MRKFLGTAALCVLLGIGAAGAQETEQTGTLELDLAGALEIALSENPTVKVADMEVERIDYVRRETLGGHLPSLSATGQYNFSIVKQEMAKGMSFGADMSAMGNADLSVPLVVPAVYAALRMNRTQQLLAVEQARSSRIELMAGVRKAFYQVMLLERSLAVLTESEATVAATVENTRTMFEAGLASEYDLLTAQVQLSNLKPSLISTENGIVVAKQMLKMLLGLPESVDISLRGSLEDSLDGNVPGMPAVPDAYGLVEGNSEVRQLDHQQALVRGQIRLANAARLPTLAAYGTLSLSGQDKTMGFGVTPEGEMGVVSTNKWWWQKPTNAGLSISVPIFSGLRNVSKVKQLRNQVAQIELQKNYLREAKALEARTAANNIMSAYQSMVANRKTVEQAEKAYSISRTRFDAGAGTMLEVNQAQLAVTQSRLNHTQAICDMLIAGAEYDRIVGTEK
ncbi:MAG: TolC family protein [Alistipes sp.]|jgi:outer membrane protein TolC|nr:TolC family protein [Alistipes sp.]